MLRALGGALDAGMVAHGEIFAPTLCAMHRHLHNNCTTADLRSRREHDLTPITTAWDDMEDDGHKLRLGVRQRKLTLHPYRWNHVDPGAGESFPTESASGDMARRSAALDMARRSALLASRFNRTLGKHGECNAICCAKRFWWCCPGADIRESMFTESSMKNRRAGAHGLGSWLKRRRIIAKDTGIRRDGLFSFGPPLR